MTNVERISDVELEDHWHGLMLRTFLKIRKAVDDAKDQGLAQKDIAARIGMNEAQLSRLLTGESNVTLKTMHKLARAVDCRIEVELTELSALRKPNSLGWTSTVGTGSWPARVDQSTPHAAGTSARVSLLSSKGALEVMAL